ncbi:hypothetical protein FA10DRAFT_303004 [Acaromyces ingoldii]|uniref:Uncharacterized protein n=1 Tax=Acaromyces ingoldii TaxID=215250 RepID=A0A316YM14_9BASI|nr:hypothetical protein FA10DRAFT_303004 [Acaromyces ingoldii]PWN89698.1 hypothetical protein FA10DRAFT_303004 [Acaromyces ingoldii]
MASRPAPPTPLTVDEQDAVLRARLALNERSLRALLKRLPPALALAGDEGDAARASLRLDVESYATGLRRLRGVSSRTTRDEVRLYTGEVQRMEAEHEQTKRDIELLKHELAAVQQERKNKLEYDALASEIKRYDARGQLQTSLEGLERDIEELEGERVKYDEVMARSQARFGSIEEQLQALRADVGFEVGERERQEVQRAGEDAGDVGTSAAAASDAAAAAAAASGAGPKLNPAAAAFRPASSGHGQGATPPESKASSRASSPARTRKRNRASRRAGAQEDDEEDDEERGSKRRGMEAGETSDVDDEEEEEEEEEGAA